jgi:hypothetical protein
MKTAVLEEKVKVPVNKITVEKAERFAKRLKIDLKELKLPNYEIPSEETDVFYLRWFEDLRVRSSEKRVLTGNYNFKTYFPTQDKIFESKPKKTYFVVEF